MLPGVNVVLLNEAERVLNKYDPASFDSTIDAFPECIELVRVVEDDQAWKGVYDSLDSFYAAHEQKHPDIRLYAKARREIETADPLTSTGPASQRLARLRAEQA
jgi:hypothetical protein